MSKTIQLIQINPEELVGLIYESVQSLINDFAKLLPNANQKELLTPSEVCELLQIDNSTLWRWTQKGKVKSYGIGGRKYYKKSELLSGMIPLNENLVAKSNYFNIVA